MSAQSSGSTKAPIFARLGPREVQRQPWDRLYRLLTSTWTLGLLAAIASWHLALLAPAGSLDPSWWAGLYMAAHRGMDFGSQVVFTYGPLGFLRQPWLWYQDLAVLGFLYSGVLYVALCTSLVWALRRTLHGAAALVLSFLILAAAPDIEVAIALTAVWCLAALSREPPPFARRFVVFGGAALGAIETLISLRSGPVILAMCAITLLAHQQRRREVAIFICCSVLVFVLAWFGSGQSLGNLPEFMKNGAQIVSGYSEAMGTPASSGTLGPVILLLGAALVAAAAITSAAGSARLAAAAVIGLASFALYKEAIVRADAGHEVIFFATAAALGTSLAFGRRRLLAVGAVIGLGALAIASPRSVWEPLNFNPITHARQATDQVRTLLSPKRRVHLTDAARSGMIIGYHLEPSTLRLLRGHSVHIDPWEIALAWTYKLNWDPLPVFQDYSAYTPALDRLNSDALRSPVGPQRILRENTGRVDPQYPTPAVDSRYPAWDPPRESIAMLCNYVPLQTTARWQVLGKTPDRCGVPQLIGSTRTRYGTTVRIPQAKPGGVVFAIIHGASVSGFERLRTLLYKARFRYVVVNGATPYRLVPGTATDGLIMDASAGADYPSPFALSPAARTILVTGSSGVLRCDFFWMRVRPSASLSSHTSISSTST